MEGGEERKMKSNCQNVIFFYFLRAEDEIKTELGRKLKEGIEKILEQVKEAVKDGKELKQEMLDKVTD